MLGQSNHLPNQEQVLGIGVPFARINIMSKNTGPKTILLSQTSMF
jgi:hypothetical protein